MTEMCEIRSPLWPGARLPARLVDPVAFFTALVLAPLLVAAGFFWVVLIPVFAVPFGVPFYLLPGAPLMAHRLRHHPARASDFAWLGLVANLGTPIIIALAALLGGDTRLLQMFGFFFGFGLIFAPAWCAVFALIYRRLERPVYAQPIPKGAFA
ncbi:MAG TPA: hypothetical protein ENK80_02380 [Rhodobacterales bacterium]|nr:hypothetical protein [Rhodobacterales bacterium]